MKKRQRILIINVILIVFVLACSIAYEGISVGDDPEDKDRQLIAQQLTDFVEPEQEDASGSADGPAVPAETLAPTTAPAAGLPPITRTETKTYSVQATNYNCICAVDSEVATPIYRFDGDTLEVLDADGNVTDEYTKTGENTYSKSFMGYYILKDEAGNSSEVEEEQRVVITFTASGYTMEHYKGEGSSPCCIHTFTEK